MAPITPTWRGRKLNQRSLTSWRRCMASPLTERHARRPSNWSCAMADSWEEFRESARKLAECVADIDEIPPHERRRFVERFVDRQLLGMSDFVVEIEESLRCSAK